MQIMNPKYRHSFITTRIVNGKWINNEGIPVDSNMDSYTEDYIYIFGHSKLFYSGYTPPQTRAEIPVLASKVFTYDINRNIVRQFGIGREFDLLPNEYYARINFNTESIETGDAYIKLDSLENENLLLPRYCHPNYKSDLSKVYELETDQQFFRNKISGNLTFMLSDYDYIMAQPFDTEFLYQIEKSNDMGLTWESYDYGKFYKTDCNFNNDDKTLVVELNSTDQYDDILDGIEKEYNVVSITPKITRIDLTKRSALQIYTLGSSIISTYIGNTYFEQQCTVVTDQEIMSRYYFAINSFVFSIDVSVNGGSTFLNGQYYGNALITGTYTYISGSSKLDDNTYQVRIDRRIVSGLSRYFIEIRNRVTEEVYFSTDVYDSGSVPVNVTMTSSSGEVATLTILQTDVYSRYLTDKEIDGRVMYNFPADDLTNNSSNYRYITPTNENERNFIITSENFSEEPTEWGISDSGLYYLPPDGARNWLPVSRNSWRNGSIWYNGRDLTEGDTLYELRDSYKLSSVIDALLKIISPNITHKDTAEYSNFLYGVTHFDKPDIRLFITPKTNITNGQYDRAAQKGLITLAQITSMLKNCYQCFWYVEDGKFKIEHISWFKNGGSYTVDADIQLDLTASKWGYITSKWNYEKAEMPERYQFKWMDDQTMPFSGYPIEILSRFVNKGKIEEINISNFSSDIDFMLLNPSGVSPDGFALMACLYDTSINKYYVPIATITNDAKPYTLQNPYAALIYTIPKFWLYDMPAYPVIIGNTTYRSFGIQRRKKQDINLPLEDDPSPIKLIRTYIGNGKITSISINLLSRMNTINLAYDTE